MKKAITVFLILCLLLSGCVQAASSQSQNTTFSNKQVMSSVPESVLPSENSLAQSRTSHDSNSQSTQTDIGSTESGFWIRFLDVGQADSALVMCGGKYMLIDGGNAADSNLIYACLKDEGVETLDYIICTHGHEDHVGGLSGALNACGVQTVLSSCKNYDSEAFRNFLKYVEQAGAQITIPEVGDEYALADAVFTILSPSKQYEDENNNSIVFRLVYQDTSFLFMGDAEREAEADILDRGFTLESDFIKIGHHGSETSTSYVFLREVMPQYAVISVGKDNSYGHPDEAVLSRLYDADVKVFRTDQNGDILVESDGKTLHISAAKNTTGSSLAAVSVGKTSSAAETGGYIGNINTKVVHLASCGNLPAPENRVYFATLEAALAQGYTPCGNCLPDTAASAQSSAKTSSSETPVINTGQTVFIGNKNTKVVHLPTCSFLPDEQNRVYFQTYQEAVAAGYRACQKCHPDR